MTTISTLPRPALHELVALERFECKQLHMSTPSPQLMRKLGVWVFRDEADDRLWMGLTDEHTHPDDRWLYHSILKDEPGHGAALWHGIGAQHTTKHETVLAGDSDPYRALHGFNDKLVNTNHMLSVSGHPKRDPAWLTNFSQVFGSLRLGTIHRLPERVNWTHLHELVWHLGSWRVKHDVLDMPLDLLLRMHGFKQLADAGAQVHPIHGLMLKGARA